MNELLSISVSIDRLAQALRTIRYSQMLEAAIVAKQNHYSGGDELFELAEKFKGGLLDE